MGAILPVIRRGDRTSHGGVVLESFPDGQSDVFGIPAAGLGHAVSCPIHHGMHRIAEGVNSYTVHGTPVALHGMATTCGATLIASQSMFSVELNETVTIAHSGAFYQDSESGDWLPGLDPGPHDEQFIVRDRSGRPLADIPYRVQTAAGKIFAGRTDNDGRTARIKTGNRPESISLSIQHGGVHD